MFFRATLARFGTINAIKRPVPAPIARIIGKGSQVIKYKINTPNQTGQNLGPRKANLNVGAFIAAANVGSL